MVPCFRGLFSLFVIITTKPRYLFQRYFLSNPYLTHRVYELNLKAKHSDFDYQSENILKIVAENVLITSRCVLRLAFPNQTFINQYNAVE